MAIRFKRVQRLCDPTNKEAGKKVYPVISYQYDTSATLDEFAKEISSASGVSEGETIYCCPIKLDNNKNSVLDC